MVHHSCMYRLQNHIISCLITCQCISRRCTNFRSPVSVEERVAVTIWKLATNVEYRTLSSLFGLGRSTVGKIVVETCRAIATHLLPQYVQIPCGEKLQEIVDEFEIFWGFP